VCGGGGARAGGGGGGGGGGGRRPARAGAVIDGSIPRNSHVLNLDKQKQREKIVLSF
jgi:hypothetical protein